MTIIRTTILSKVPRLAEAVDWVLRKISKLTQV
jgi:hypothetical protein